MPAEISAYLKYANLQMAAESLFGLPRSALPGVVSTEMTLQSLTLGNERASLFTAPQAQQFIDEGWTVVEHKSNTETGFSGTLFRNSQTGEQVLSFRSTEFADDAVRDNQATNAMEIKEHGWAFGQIADMEAWYACLQQEGLLSADSNFSVTGYSLGGHLATAFNLLRQQDGTHSRITNTYTFNGAGVGNIVSGNLTDVMATFQQARTQGSASLFSSDLTQSLYNDLRQQFNGQATSQQAEQQRVSLQGLVADALPTARCCCPRCWSATPSTPPARSIASTAATFNLLTPTAAPPSMPGPFQGRATSTSLRSANRATTRRVTYVMSHVLPDGSWTYGTAAPGRDDYYQAGRIQSSDSAHADRTAIEYNGLGGNDVIVGYSYDDTLLGGAGDDIIFGDAGSDRVDGGDGNDILFAGHRASLTGLYPSLDSIGVATTPWMGGNLHSYYGNSIHGSWYVGKDEYGNLVTTNLQIGEWHISGTPIYPDENPGDSNTLIGGAGDDYVWGALGSDIVDGGTGDDQLQGLGGRDTLLGGDGNDTIFGDSNPKAMRFARLTNVGTEAAELNSHPQHEVPLGEQGNDFIDGGNTLRGWGGDDILLGGVQGDEAYSIAFGGGHEQITEIEGWFETLNQPEGVLAGNSHELLPLPNCTKRLTRRGKRYRLRRWIWTSALLGASAMASAQGTQPPEWELVAVEGQALPIPQIWLDSNEARIAHSIKLPDAVPKPQHYDFNQPVWEKLWFGAHRKAAVRYFDHLCATEAGQWIVRTVPDVDGFYFARPQGSKPPHLLMTERWAPENPWVERALIHTDSGALRAAWTFIYPPFMQYDYIEQPRRDLPWQKDITEIYVRLFGYTTKNARHVDGHQTTHLIENTPMKVEGVERLQSRYGFTWRGIKRPQDREHGIAGGEMLIYDLQTKDVLAVRRQFAISLGNRRTGDSAAWEIAATCSKLNSRNSGATELREFALTAIPSTRPSKSGRKQ